MVIKEKKIRTLYIKRNLVTYVANREILDKRRPSVQSSEYPTTTDALLELPGE
jgi:hypothetical protein